MVAAHRYVSKKIDLILRIHDYKYGNILLNSGFK